MKRFTETTKWQDAWYRKLPLKMKVFWQYLVDNCDLAGVWNADLELAGFQIGESISEDEVNSYFEGRISVLENGRWFLTKFVEFQYGELNPANRCHQAVIKSLQNNKIEGPSKGLPRASRGPKDKDKDKDKDSESQSDLPKFDPTPQIARLFRRRESTPWSDKERKALKLAGEITEVDLNLIERYYAKEREKGEKGIHRRDMVTFLNNYQGELDRARMTVKAPAAANQCRDTAPDPEGWKSWLSENYPRAEGQPFWKVKTEHAEIAKEFEAHQKRNQ